MRSLESICVERDGREHEGARQRGWEGIVDQRIPGPTGRENYRLTSEHCSFLSLLTVLTSCIQEPRKSDAPQLRDEYRTYKILAGSREFSRYSQIDLFSCWFRWAGLPQMEYLKCITLVKKDFTMFSSLICSDLHWKICSTCVEGNSRSKRWSWLRNKWYALPLSSPSFHAER